MVLREDRLKKSTVSAMSKSLLGNVRGNVPTLSVSGLFFSPQNLKLISEYCTYSSFKCDSQDCSYGWLVWENNLRIGKMYNYTSTA